MEEFAYELKIPQERIAVLIGKDGETKTEVEKATKSQLNISQEGDVTIMGEDALLMFSAKEIVHAIARGFNPKTALLLLKTDYALEIIDMKEVAGKNRNTLQRIKGRVIGKGGTSREEIERLTECYVSVYGKTIGIIGELQHVSIAREAIAMLLSGSMHKTVFSFLERKKKEVLFG
ncbi:MAG TPA: KH domain-containing protein [Candidatus Nanoarchaeia archaeon]|nr:KH domain-containing protein [Candidatus Nanoarchaeia archaeon]